MSYRREISKMNKENFKAWKELMRIHLEIVGELGLKHLDAKYKVATRTMTIEQIIEKKIHNVEMIDIA